MIKKIKNGAVALSDSPIFNLFGCDIGSICDAPF